MPKLSVTITCLGTLANLSEMSPELLLATTSAAASPVTEMFPKLSCSRVSPVHPGRLDVAGVVVQPDASGQAGGVDGAEAVGQADGPGQPERGQVPELSDSVTVPCRPLRVQRAERVADADAAARPGR